MSNSKCLYCYNDLTPQEKDFHFKCSKYFFGKSQPLEIDLLESELEDKGLVSIKDRKSITGVHKKLALNLDEKGIYIKQNGFSNSQTSGYFIIKPRTDYYPFIAEYEDLTMHLAEISKINVVPHSLIRMKSGNLAYITERIDRTKSGEKIHMEDMCQLTEKLTEDKYKGSYEQIANMIRKYTNRELDVINFAEVIIFSFITGNSDMHLKNFSLIENKFNNYEFAPAYDLIPVKLILKSDIEDLALNLNDKKTNLTLHDFIKFTNAIKLNRKVFDNIILKFLKKESEWYEFISRSFIPDKRKEEYIKLIKTQLNIFRKVEN